MINNMKQMTPIAGLIIIALAVGGCSIFSSDDDEIKLAGKEDVYAGIYSQGIEDSSFKPCIAQNEVWKLINIEDTSFIRQIIKFKENPVYVKLKGVPSEKGEFRGFFMTYDRQFTVQKVVHIGSLQENGCPLPIH